MLASHCTHSAAAWAYPTQSQIWHAGQDYQSHEPDDLPKCFFSPQAGHMRRTAYKQHVPMLVHTLTIEPAFRTGLLLHGAS